MNLKCPKCGGSVVYDVESGMMKCDYCNRLASREEFSKPVEAVPAASTTKSSLSLKQNTDFKSSDAQEPSLRLKGAPAPTPDFQQETDFLNTEPTQAHTTISTENMFDEFMEINIYHCSSCGADLMVGSTQAATFCSYCGSPSIVYDRVSKEQKPSKIIPFKISEEQALACIKDRFGHGSYIPSKIKNLTVNEVHAIYIPFWLYNAYIRKSVIITANSDNGHYTYNRDVSCTYQNIPMDGSLKLSNDLSHRLEPYYMNELEDFDLSYLSGYYADKYDVPYDVFEDQVHKRCQKFINAEISRSCPEANIIQTKSGNIKNYSETNDHEEYERQGVSYALLPAYFVNIEYEHSKELIIVNGQTGKVVGNLPVEKEQFMFMFIRNAVIACIIYSLLSILFLSVPKLSILFFFPILINAILLGSGISGYKKYKLGIQQFASGNMTSYANRTEDL